jgi:signal transduction histidine kinase
MLEKAVAAVKADKAKALDMFNRGEGGFKDRDLYVLCLNASDGVLTAHPKIEGTKAQTLKDANGFAFGEKFVSTATEDKVSEIAYVWPRPGSDKPVPKVSYFTKVADQICGVGYYK